MVIMPKLSIVDNSCRMKADGNITITPLYLLAFLKTANNTFSAKHNYSAITELSNDRAETTEGEMK